MFPRLLLIHLLKFYKLEFLNANFRVFAYEPRFIHRTHFFRRLVSIHFEFVFAAVFHLASHLLYVCMCAVHKGQKRKCVFCRKFQFHVSVKRIYVQNSQLNNIFIGILSYNVLFKPQKIDSIFSSRHIAFISFALGSRFLWAFSKCFCVFFCSPFYIHLYLYSACSFVRMPFFIVILPLFSKLFLQPRCCLTADTKNTSTKTAKKTKLLHQIIGFPSK